MAGTINLSLSQQLDEFGQPLSGGQLYVIQAGTVSTPQNAFQDAALTIPLPNPITLDAAGRIPQFYLADGQIKVRLQDASGVVKFVADNLLVIGPSAGGGGGGGVDPTTVMQTGDIKIRYDSAVIAGFVRANGKTIGSATSGGTELADPSAQALFLHLWARDGVLVVAPGGRGASAAADWAANKTIALPDGRNRLLMALGDMGNADIGLLAGATFDRGNGTTLGSIFGTSRIGLDTSRIPAHQHGVFLKENPHTHGLTNLLGSTTLTTAGGPEGYGGGAGSHVGLTSGFSINNATTGITVGSVNGVANDNQTAPVGSGVAPAISHVANPAMLITVYLKL